MGTPSMSIINSTVHTPQTLAGKETENSANPYIKVFGHILSRALIFPLWESWTWIKSFCKFPYRQPDMTLIVADDNYQDGLDDAARQKHTPVNIDGVAKRWGKPKRIMKLDRQEAGTILQYVSPSEDSGWESLKGSEYSIRKDDQSLLTPKNVRIILTGLEKNKENTPSPSVGNMEEFSMEQPQSIKITLTADETSDDTQKFENEINLDYGLWTDILKILGILKTKFIQNQQSAQDDYVTKTDIETILKVLKSKENDGEIVLNENENSNFYQVSDGLKNEIQLPSDLWKDINEILTILLEPSNEEPKNEIELEFEESTPLGTLNDKESTEIQVPRAINISTITPENVSKLTIENDSQPLESEILAAPPENQEIEIEPDPGNYKKILSVVPEEIKINSEFKIGKFYDPETTLTMLFFYNKESNEIAVTFSGIEDVTPDSKEIECCVDSLMGEIPPNFAQADKLIKEMKDNLAQFNNQNTDKITLRLVGHSLGGAIAAYVGGKNAISFFTFNGMKLGRGLLRDMGKEGRKNAQVQGRRYVVETDWVSDELQGSGLVSWGLKLFPDAQHLGELCLIPKEYTTIKQNNGTENPANAGIGNINPTSDYQVQDVHNGVPIILENIMNQASAIRTPSDQEWEEIDFNEGIDKYMTNADYADNMKWEEIDFDKTKKKKWID